MRIFDFGPEAGREITSFDSRDLRGLGLVRTDTASVTALHIGAGGEIGRHAATVDQMFLVVSGRGAVCGDDGDWQPIAAGQAVVWRAGEQHTTRADDALTAVVVEVHGLSLAT